MVWISLMLVGTGFFLIWFWAKLVKNPRTVLPLRKEGSFIQEKNIVVKDSYIREFSILFSAGSSKLEKEAMDILRVEWEPKSISQIGYIQLFGSADVSGHLAKNRRLVKERVRNVNKYLLSLGISNDKINQTFLEPIYGKSPELRRLLRSVKIQYKIET
ncbi:OmpA family protein [Leptospira kanakyensis]|uniref:cell envelope biogenesis protein OmpA n=1 Tax=Leptospira kanakyensis TaxID=2484968 RepID=UPI00223D62FE|nr:cell envelope biogenesis protein OmpA [Leptospira kanakyensis]MCW7468398.1 cell envelope biogenesis protein OmpA [Leptospira kanakyensis]